MTNLEVLRSQEDASVNFIWKGDPDDNFPGMLEARYVRRSPDYFVCYLSSQSGCIQACRFCHLTATGQTALIDVSIDGLLMQATKVLEYAKEQPSAKVVHFSYMARGEALANQYILKNNRELFTRLHDLAQSYSLFPKYMISTIMPKVIEDRSLTDIFHFIYPTIYYSIYTMNSEFRKRWLPKAMDPNKALDKLVDYQRLTGKLIRLHWAFIEGENDSEADVLGIIQAVKQRKLRVDVNIVRYNPASEKHGRETPEEVVQKRAETLRLALPDSHIKVVDRVGRDVRASCGMFIPGKK